MKREGRIQKYKNGSKEQTGLGNIKKKYHRGYGCLSLVSVVLSGRGLCDGPIPHPEESYGLWCLLQCDQMKSQKPSILAVNK
jgi:hypothetical protein